MNSIRKKLFLYIGLLMVLLVGMTLLSNTFLFRPYYVSKQKDTLISYYDLINAIDSEDYGENFLDFTKIENEYHVDILLSDGEKNILYTSNGYLADPEMLGRQNLMGQTLPNKSTNDKNAREIQPNLQIEKREPINENAEFLWVFDQVIGVKQLVLRGRLDNRALIELKIPLAAIEANIQLANDFSLIIGGVVILFAMVFAYIISNNFTKPIRQMNTITKHLKNLDFKSRCNVSSNDEIGQLAVSINEMSDELSGAMGQLNDKNKQLVIEIDEKTRLDEKRRELLSNVSHELKTPLALMQGYAEGLKRNVVKNKEKSDFYCDVIMDESSKMNQLVSKLLNINQVEFGDKTLNKTKFEINDFISNILSKYEKVFFDQKIACEFYRANKMIALADAFMMESVFTNYLNNAINYIDEKKKMTVCVKEKGDKIRVDVFNTAKPFDKEDIKNIWLSFYKVDKARSREKGGHGLGLAIVNSIQQAHGNACGVDNQPDGVCFWFEIDQA